MTDSTKLDKSNLLPGEYLSRRQAAHALKVAPPTLDRLVKQLGIRTFQVPGHSRQWINREDVEKLIADASGQGFAGF
jgi:hypothetical protein